MKKILFPMFIIFLLLPFLYTYSFSETEKDRTESPNLTVDEALSLLKDLDPNIKVIAVKSSPIEGLWEVDIETGGRKVPVYVDFSKKHLISGSIFDIKEKKNLTQERLSEINKVDVSQIPLDDAVVMGDKNAKHRVIVFDDPD
jgi:thiol:disulfide interchange protein DsbC